jgi:hypothetical protein
VIRVLSDGVRSLCGGGVLANRAFPSCYSMLLRVSVLLYYRTIAVAICTLSFNLQLLVSYSSLFAIIAFFSASLEVGKWSYDRSALNPGFLNC